MEFRLARRCFCVFASKVAERRTPVGQHPTALQSITPAHESMRTHSVAGRVRCTERAENCQTFLFARQANFRESPFCSHK